MSSKNQTPSVSGGAVADWYGWAASPDTPGATIINLMQVKPPKSQQIKLAPGQSVVGLLPAARVAAGQTALAKFQFNSTSNDAVSLRVMLLRNDGDEPTASFKTFVKAGAVTVLGRISGTFKTAHASLRLELKNIGASDAEFVIGRPTIQIS